MAAGLGWSERHLWRRFAEVVGVPVGGYLRAQQADRARAGLRAGMSVTGAAIERDDDGLSEVAAILADAVRGRHDATVLPVDLQGTAFQVRVWEALRAIPAGDTRSYAEVATQIGAPTAVRAVAGACAANPAALAVPCHRVVRHDGSLGGYRWGAPVKQALLAAESASQMRR